jgi:signal transduction histidine kinase
MSGFSAEVKVEFGENNVSVSISDHGVGFTVPENVGGLIHIGKLGLAGMEERVHLLGGTLNICSEPGKGTTIQVEPSV